MKLYLVQQIINDDYDTYDAIVVAAMDDVDARRVKNLDTGTWVANYADLEVTEIGIAKKGTERGIILESFNAG